jgi:hypothetical protein
MGRIAILAMVMFVVVGMSGIVIPAYSQQQAGQQQIANSVSAEVVSMDLVKSTLTIKTLKDAVTQTYGNQTISVLSGTKILKGDAILMLSELKAGDKVTVKYTSDTLGNWKVESISLETAEVAPVTK